MYNIALASDEERRIIFSNAADKLNMKPAIVEKDFWVCLTLDYLFHKCKWSKAFAFKGGTSLSKAYNLIERFSEDIDLILDWRVIGYEKNEPWEIQSNTKMQKFIEESRSRLFRFLAEEFTPVFKKDMSALLHQDIHAFISEEDPGTVNFVYPNQFEESAILNVIRLEIGALAAWTPTQMATITPYIAECYPQIFTVSDTDILTTTAARTFWEKATILHQEAHRPENSKLPARYSRHYYDIYCMANTSVKAEAVSQPDLLEKVAEFKRQFYPRGWAKYDEARTGTLKLYPAKHSIPALKRDYESMQAMIYGNTPSFDEILNYIAKLENDINHAG